MRYKGFPQFPQSFPQGVSKMWKIPKVEKHLPKETEKGKIGASPR